MSLDVYLNQPNREKTSQQKAADFLRTNGFEREADVLEFGRDPDYVGPLFDSNITHNLNRMAKAAGIYEACWKPEEIGITHARQLIEPLQKGLSALKADPAKFKKFNAENGWGMYEHFVPWVEQYLRACEQHPDAEVSVSR